MFVKCFKYNQTGIDNLKSECKTKDITEELVLKRFDAKWKNKKENYEKEEVTD